MHYKKIRQDPNVRELPSMTRSWLYRLRKEELAFERRFQRQIEAAKAESLCTAIVHARSAVSTQYREIPARPAQVCQRPAFRRGYCRQHYFSHTLYVQDPQSDRAGRGVTRRPFSASALPVGRMSEAQLDLLGDLRRLPMRTTLAECILAMNLVDPSNPISAAKRRK